MTIELFDATKDTAVRDWPAYNAINLNKVDEYIGIIGPTEYNPTFSSVAGSTPPNIGDAGTVTGVWFRIIDVVFVWGDIAWSGSGIDPGSGSNWFTVSLPVPILGLPASINIGVGAIIGQAHCRDNSDNAANSQPGVVQAQSTTTASFSSTRGNSSGAWRNDVPFTWATGDRINWSACYRAALI